MKLKFKDIATFDEQEKTAISVRDGVLEYHASELGMDPAIKEFISIYRSPATISNAAMKMQGIPVTNEHVDLDETPSLENGSVISSEMIDVIENGIATIAIKNKLRLSDNFVNITKEKKELSLGYYAELIPHDIYDFEQRDIIPHHLAIVPAGRCGDMCSFIDRKTTELKQMLKFIDADGAVDLETIAMVMQQLPEAIKKIPVDKLAEIVPMLKELIESAQSAMPEEEAEEVETESKEATEDKDIEAEDSDSEDAQVETEDTEETEMKDEDAEEDKKEAYSDSAKFKDAVKAAVKAEREQFSLTVDKARLFLDSTYSFADKDLLQIMRDAIATQSRETFVDADLPVAFKLLAKDSRARQFVETKEICLLDSLGEKEL